MKRKTKIWILCAACVLIMLNLSAIFSMAAVPGDAEPNSFIGPCYQSMGYCSGTLTYMCKKDMTSERCRRYACAPTCEKGTEPHIE